MKMFSLEQEFINGKKVKNRIKKIHFINKSTYSLNDVLNINPHT